MRLYEIIHEIYDLLTTSDEDWDSYAKAKLHNLKITLKEKVENICKVLSNLEADEAIIDFEIRRLKERRELLKRRIERLKGYAAHCLGEGQKIETPLFTAYTRTFESVGVVDEAAIPPQYIRQTVKYAPDKVRIREDLKCGAVIPGVRLEQNVHFHMKQEAGNVSEI